MAGEALLQMLNATPQEQAALRQISMLRAQGIPDDQIFSGLADPSFTQAGGYGFLPYITDMAGITSSYNLGRGNIALQAQADEYQRQGNPYNVVTALQNMRDTGNSAILTDPTLANVQPGPASIYSQYIKGLFDETDGPAVAQTTGTVANAQNPIAASNMAPQPDPRYIPAGIAPELGGFFGGGGGQTANIGTASGTRGTGGTSPYVTTNTAPTNADTGAQSAAARLLSGSIPVGTPFQQRLSAGQVPGFNSLNERDMSLLSPDQQASYMGLVGSTGRVSDPMQAYNQYLRLYSQGGSQGARTYR